MTTTATGPSTIADRGTGVGPDGVTADNASAACEGLVRDHAGRIYRVAYGLTRNTHDAQDLTQDVLLRVFRHLASYKPGNFEGWLYRITVNVFRDQVRRNRRLRSEPLRDDAGDRHAARGPRPEQLLTEPVFDDDVRDALAALNPEVRIAVLLCDVEGFTYEEIAAVLGVNRSTVGTRIHRGRAQLRTALAHRKPHTRAVAAPTTARAAA